MTDSCAFCADSEQEPLRFVCGFEVAELSYLPLQRTLFAAGKHLSVRVTCTVVASLALVLLACLID
jgi:hypothetical protein